jgi:hypothetical protein
MIHVSSQVQDDPGVHETDRSAEEALEQLKGLLEGTVTMISSSQGKSLRIAVTHPKCSEMLDFEGEPDEMAPLIEAARARV